MGLRSWLIKRRLRKAGEIENEIEDLREKESRGKEKVKFGMGGKFIGKDNSTLFIFAVVLALVGIVGVTIFFNSMFQNLNDKYNDKLSELNKITQELQAKQGLLNSTTFELKIKNEKEKDLSAQYKDLKGERDALQQEKLNLMNENTRLQSQIDQLKADIVSKNNEIKRLNKKIDDLQNG